MNHHRRSLLKFLAMASMLAIGNSAFASTLYFGYTNSFGELPPDPPAPYATAKFDDGNTPGSVKLTLHVANTVGIADATGFYFNLDPNLDPTALSFSAPTGTGPTPNSINLGGDSFQADGDGIYDIWIDLPPPPGSQRFEAGETLIFDITGIPSLVASDFNYLAEMGGGNGPFFSVARFQSTGSTGGNSDWVGADIGIEEHNIPEPGSVMLVAMVSGCLLLSLRRTAADSE